MKHTSTPDIKNQLIDWLSESPWTRMSINGPTPAQTPTSKSKNAMKRRRKKARG